MFLAVGELLAQDKTLFPFFSSAGCCLCFRKGCSLLHFAEWIWISAWISVCILSPPRPRLIQLSVPAAQHEMVTLLHNWPPWRFDMCWHCMSCKCKVTKRGLWERGHGADRHSGEDGETSSDSYWMSMKEFAVCKMLLSALEQALLFLQPCISFHLSIFNQNTCKVWRTMCHAILSVFTQQQTPSGSMGLSFQLGAWD